MQVNMEPDTPQQVSWENGLNSHLLSIKMYISFNAIQDKGAKRPPYQFFSCNFYERKN